ncbi:hypothetical protein BN1013_00823 [Candidatus Rubidus massiliensis]|nr:MAG: hypothetical protein BGO10_03460 [Chlamydia sp. 32-24]CDZ80313.1 hypothetical protein BN1013_00823 [Candidatus Rubidus massiliensis]
MKKRNKFFALATLVAMLASASVGAQEEFFDSTGGYGYQESRTAPSIAPAIALGTIAIVAIIAVAVQNRSHHGSHSHGHSHF